MSNNSFVDKKKLIKGFLIKAVTCYVLWQLLYIGLIRPHTSIEQTMIDGVVIGTVSGLKILGFNSTAEGNIVFVNGDAAVRIEKECSGLELIALYIGFLISFPGRFRPKLVYILVGSIALYIVNIIRDVVLALNSTFFRPSFELNHKYTYTIIVYFIVFLIWKHWVKNYSLVAK